MDRVCGPDVHKGIVSFYVYSHRRRKKIEEVFIGFLFGGF